jgi:hypothetical protein
MFQSRKVKIVEVTDKLNRKIAGILEGYAKAGQELKKAKS